MPKRLDQVLVIKHRGDRHCSFSFHGLGWRMVGGLTLHRLRHHLPPSMFTGQAGQCTPFMVQVEELIVKLRLVVILQCPSLCLPYLPTYQPHSQVGKVGIQWQHGVVSMSAASGVTDDSAAWLADENGIERDAHLSRTQWCPQQSHCMETSCRRTTMIVGKRGRKGSSRLSFGACCAPGVSTETLRPRHSDPATAAWRALPSFFSCVNPTCSPSAAANGRELASLSTRRPADSRKREGGHNMVNPGQPRNAAALWEWELLPSPLHSANLRSQAAHMSRLGSDLCNQDQGAEQA